MKKPRTKMSIALTGLVALGAAVASADDAVAWVFEGDTNRAAVATVAASKKGPLVKTLEYPPAVSAPVTLTSRKPCFILIMR